MENKSSNRANINEMKFHSKFLIYFETAFRMINEPMDRFSQEITMHTKGKLTNLPTLDEHIKILFSSNDLVKYVNVIILVNNFSRTKHKSYFVRSLQLINKTTKKNIFIREIRTLTEKQISKFISAKLQTERTIVLTLPTENFVTWSASTIQIPGESNN
ncbi:hypothetical protein H8356DRAFT_1357811 [Neocallimastix lanati (nom. inval.)]|nr:hypothetical protein H8356DRAFT_1357811 [Neocallimastix sp. JGI-2020a]